MHRAYKNINKYMYPVRGYGVALGTITLRRQCSQLGRQTVALGACRVGAAYLAPYLLAAIRRANWLSSNKAFVHLLGNSCHLLLQLLHHLDEPVVRSSRRGELGRREQRLETPREVRKPRRSAAAGRRHSRIKVLDGVCKKTQKTFPMSSSS